MSSEVKSGPVYSVLSQKAGYVPLYKMDTNEKSWRKLMRGNEPDYQPSASMAYLAAKQFVNRKLYGTIRAVCPMRTSQDAQKKEFYDKRSFQISESIHMSRRTLDSPVVVMNNKYKVTGKIGIFK